MAFAGTVVAADGVIAVLSSAVAVDVDVDKSVLLGDLMGDKGSTYSWPSRKRIFAKKSLSFT